MDIIKSFFHFYTNKGLNLAKIEIDIALNYHTINKKACNHGQV